MNTLEKRILKQSLETKQRTLYYLKRGEPFTYMLNLSKAGEKLYGIPAKESFYYAVDKSLDWYNSHKRYSNNFSTEFYALKQGAEWVLRYCYYNKPKEEDEE